MNLSKRGVAGTAGLPGSGMSYRHVFSKGQVIVLLLLVVVVLAGALVFVLARGGTLREVPGLSPSGRDGPASP